MYKNKSKTNVENYRPISVLSIIYKVNYYMNFSLVFGRRIPSIHVLSTYLIILTKV